MTNTLKQLRLKHHLSQTEMAEKLYMSQSAYSKLENEKTSLRKEVILILIKEFGSSAEELLSTDEMQIVLKEKDAEELLSSFVSKESFDRQKEIFEKIMGEKDKEIKRLSFLIEELSKEKTY